MSGSKVRVRPASAAATVNVSGRPHPVPMRAPAHPCRSRASACSASTSRLARASATVSPRWPGSTVLGMYQRNSVLMRCRPVGDAEWVRQSCGRVAGEVHEVRELRATYVGVLALHGDEEGGAGIQLRGVVGGEAVA